MNSNRNQTIRTVSIISKKDMKRRKSSTARHMLQPGLAAILEKSDSIMGAVDDGGQDRGLLKLALTAAKNWIFSFFSHS